MLQDELEYSYDNLVSRATGAHEIPEDYRIVVYPFGKYRIKVKLTQANEFAGIVEVEINKEFLSYKQKVASPSFHDVSEFYPE